MKADYIMVGGFLGAGKTTAILRLAEHLASAGRRVGLITNDQSTGLVDTALVEARGYPVEEITGGCFCCRFGSLTAAAERLQRDAAPDVFVAEPVGSCTDLRASVQYPLRRLYGDNYRVAPLSVLVDPIRALRVLDLEPGPAFSPKVRYVYRTQLDEAEIIVINKQDLVGADRLARLEDALRLTFPAAEVVCASARTGRGLDAWFSRVVGSDTDTRPAPAVDYDEYADGEALLGWFNGTYRLDADEPFDGNAFLTDVAQDLGSRLAAEGLEVAHFKMTLAPDTGLGDLGAVNLVGSDRAPELSHRLADALQAGELIVNLRAEGKPDALDSAVAWALAKAVSAAGARATVVHQEHFRPSRPSPTHRMATVEG